MILEWLVQLAKSASLWMVGLFPAWTFPPELTGAGGALQELIAFGHGLGPFVDWPFVMICAAIPMVTWSIGLGVRAGRVLIGHFPLIGGNG